MFCIIQKIFLILRSLKNISLSMALKPYIHRIKL